MEKLSKLASGSSSDAKYHTYSSVPIHNAEDEQDIGELEGSRSSTQVDEALMQEEEGRSKWEESGIRPRRSKRGTCMRWAVQEFRWLLEIFLLVVILALVWRNRGTGASSEGGDQWQFGGDFTGVGPKFSKQIVKFQMDPSYAPSNTSEFFTQEVLDKWNKLMPLGMGFVWVNDTHRYHDLPHPIEWPDKTVFTTSVTHQLHCLYAIVQTYSGLNSGLPLPDDHHWHMIHCFDYMRQAIMCNADLALEGHATTFPDDNSGSDGWDSKHVCKNYDEVRAYLESVRAYDDQQIY